MDPLPRPPSSQPSPTSPPSSVQHVVRFVQARCGVALVGPGVPELVARSGHDPFLLWTVLSPRVSGSDRARLSLLGACVEAYRRGLGLGPVPIEQDSLRVLGFIAAIRDHLVGSSALLAILVADTGLVLDLVEGLSFLTKAGKDFLGLGSRRAIETLVRLGSAANACFEAAVQAALLGPHPLQSSRTGAPCRNFVRFRPGSPSSPVLVRSAALLISITKFSSPQLAPQQVKQVINLFINHIGLVTRSEVHLSIILDYINTLVVFGYVPTLRLASRSVKSQAQQPVLVDLEGENLLFDLVSFVASIVGLQGTDSVACADLDWPPLARDSGPASPSSPLKDPSLPQSPPGSSSHSLFPTVEAVALDQAIVQRAKSCMKDLIRSPANQAIKSLLNALTCHQTQANPRLTIGAIRCLRYAYHDYEDLDHQVRGSSGSAVDEQHRGMETSLTLLGLGLSLVKDSLCSILSCQDRSTIEIDTEILLLIRERLECTLRAGNCTGMTHLMRREDVECSLALLLAFVEHRLPVWLDHPDLLPPNWAIELDEQAEPWRSTDSKAQTPPALFEQLFNMLFSHHAPPTSLGEHDGLVTTRCLHDTGQYFEWCLRLCIYLSTEFMVKLMDQIETHRVCTPETSGWLLNLHRLVEANFQFDQRCHYGQEPRLKLVPTQCKSQSCSQASQLRLLHLIMSVFDDVRDLEHLRKELLRELIIPTFVRLLLSPYFPPFDDSSVVDVALDFIRDILYNELVNEFLDHSQSDKPLFSGDPDPYEWFLQLLGHMAKMGSSVDLLNPPLAPRATKHSFSEASQAGSPSASSPSETTTIIPPPSPLHLKASITSGATIFNSTRLSSSLDPSRTPNTSSVALKRARELSYRAVLTLIKAFGTSLALSTTYSNIKCAKIFKELLSLLRAPYDLTVAPNNSHHVSASTGGLNLNDLEHDLSRKKLDNDQFHQLDGRAKLAILKLMLRLRADEEHRIQFVRDLEIDGLALIIRRDTSLDLKTHARYSSVMEPRGNFQPTERRFASSPVPASSKPWATSATKKYIAADEQDGTRRSTPLSPSVLLHAGPPGPISAVQPSDPFGHEKMLWTVPDDVTEFGWPSKIEPHSTHSLVTFDHVTSKDWDPSQEPFLSTAPKPSPICEHYFTSPLTVLPISDYLAAIISILRYETDWEIISYVLCHLPAQLSNKHFACGPGASQQIHQLRRLLCNGIKTDGLLHQVQFPSWQRVKLTDAHAISYQTLSTLIAYKALFDKSQADEMVGAFAKGLSRYKDTAKACIHALSLSCHELQPSITKFLPEILRELTKIVSSAYVSMHILELLGFLGRIRSLYANLTEEEYKIIFGIALQFITNHNQQQRLDDFRSPPHQTCTKVPTTSPEQVTVPTEDKTEGEVQTALQQYVYLMAFYVIALWFVSLKISDRRKYVTFITRKLVQACEGKTKLDEMTEVCFDMLSRTTSWILGNSILTIKCLSRPGWTEVCVRRPSGMVKMIWELENLSGDHGASEQDVLEMVIRHRDTLDFAASGDLDVKESDCNPQETPDGSRSAAGDDCSQYSQWKAGSDSFDATTTPTSSNWQVSLASVMSRSAEITRTTGIEPNYTDLSIEPSFFALQLIPFSDISSTQHGGGVPVSKPLRVPDEPKFQRAVEMIDYAPVVDFHKIGVLYVGPGQTTEAEILTNQEGSKAYIQFISSLGQLVRLKGCEHYNTGGLDSKNDTNGRFAYIWGDDITQICFHIATLMPSTREELPDEGGPDPILNKKALIGNDFVRIVFNDSGKEYDFNCLDSQFNFVNIVIEPNTPINSSYNLKAGVQNELKFFKITLQRKPGLPRIGPMENFKMISSQSLGGFVRSLSLHANTFVQVYLECVGAESRLGNKPNVETRRKVEYVSNWRGRLREIRRLKERILENDRQSAEGQQTAAQRSDQQEESSQQVSTAGPAVSLDIETLSSYKDFSSWT